MKIAFLRKINAKRYERSKICYRHPHLAVTADCVISGFDGLIIKALLIQRDIDPFKYR